VVKLESMRFGATSPRRIDVGALLDVALEDGIARAMLEFASTHGERTPVFSERRIDDVRSDWHREHVSI
jgi:hypothetical protein